MLDGLSAAETVEGRRERLGRPAGRNAGGRSLLRERAVGELSTLAAQKFLNSPAYVDTIGNGMSDGSPRYAPGERGIGSFILSGSETIAFVVASSDEGHLLDRCLDSSRGFDEVIVFDLESSDDTVAIARRHSGRIVTLSRPSFIEQVRGRQLKEVSSDWIFFADPDEVLPVGWIKAARDLVARSPDSVSAYWISYRQIAFGTPLSNTPIGTGKIALIRRAHASPQPQGTVRPHQMLLLVGQVERPYPPLPPVDHYGYRVVAESIAKLTRYSIGGGSSRPLSSVAPTALTLIGSLWSSIVKSRAYRDGAAGVAVASLSAIGDYLGQLQRWDEAGNPGHTATLSERLALDTAWRLSRTFDRIRSKLRRAKPSNLRPRTRA